MAHSSLPPHHLVFWGRADLSYSRNAVARKVMEGLGWKICDHAPGMLESIGLCPATGLPKDTKLVWVPCFRQRDMKSAARFAKKRGLPLIFDPLISAYDKQVFERKKFPQDSTKAHKLLSWEREIFGLADLVIADTQAHANYYHKVLGVDSERLAVIPVGADETMFKATPMKSIEGRRPKIVFFGSFIHLQGPEVIAEAATLCPEADWYLLGHGPMRDRAVQKAKGMKHIHFEDYPGYESLPQRIADADIVMGVFSNSRKAGRVIPNKLWQAMAGGRPVITRSVESGAFPWPDDPAGQSTGVATVSAGDPKALADGVRALIEKPEALPEMGQAARRAFEIHGGFDTLRQAFVKALDRAGIQSPNDP